MKRFYFSKLVILTAIFLGWNLGAYAQTTTFSYTGSVQHYTVPAGVTSIGIDARGGEGGTYPGFTPGHGGRVQATMNVTPGQVYNIFVGQVGTNGTCCGGAIPAGGSNSGGGAQGGSGSNSIGGGAGGGATDIRYGGTALSNRILVAGGGGAGSYDCGETGGNGGGITGGNGNDCGSPFSPTAGGSQSAGGYGGYQYGGLGYGGNAYPYDYGGGGGGGYYGGGGQYYGSGGGGSSYPASATGNFTSITHTQGYNSSGNGEVIISPPPAAGTSSFSYTGSVQYYTVPSGITSVTTTVAGGEGATSSYGSGGCGGTVVCSLAVTPAQVLNVYVGGAGGITGGGWNGGGSAGPYGSGGGGGGASDIRYGGVAISNRLIVAGGGGGGGMYESGSSGGAGGGLTGASGNMFGYFYSGYSPTGGTQTAGGANGTDLGGSATTQGSGNNGYYYSGGGGGGYWGGGIGYYYPGGGGGSSYVGGTGVSGVSVNSQGSNCDAGSVQIVPNCTAGAITGTLSTCTTFTTTLTDAVSIVGAGWTSSNTAKATVSSGGVVTGVSTGTATISYGPATCGSGVYATAVVNVVAAPGTITGSATICQTQNQTYALSSGSGGTWSVSTVSGGVATIGGATGIATGVTAGTVNISYNISATCYSTPKTVTIYPTASVTAAGGATTLCAGLPLTLSNANPAAGAYTWSSSNPTTAAIDPSTGIVTGGTTVLSPTAVTLSFTDKNSCVMTYGLLVNPLPVPFTGRDSVCIGLKTTLTETSTGGLWTTSTSAVATVGSTGATTAAVLGITAGTTSITYTLPTSCIRNDTVTVNPNPVAIIANPNICQGLTYPLSDATAGGTWSSSVPTAASIVTLTSIQGIATSPPVPIIITYTLPTSCIATMTATVQPLPSGILANVPVCVNVQAILSDSTTGGVWTSNDITKATVGYGTGVLTGVAAGNPSITYTLPTGCITLTTATVNALPSPISSTLGTFDVCVGSSDPLADGGAGTWSSSNPGLASVDMSSGIVMGLLPGLPVITYTLPPTAGSCMITTTVTVNPVPAPITGSPQVCYGLTTTLNDATGGGTWSSTIPGNASVDPSGVVTGTSASGAATDINYTLSTGCEATMSFTDNALPTQYTVSGTGNYCPGTTPPDISITPSDIGVNYQLYYNGSPIAYEVLGGTGSTLDFGTGHTAAGNYTVVATNAATGCTQNMNGTAVIGILPAPQVRVLGVSNGGNYCVGSAGVDMYIDSSEDISIAYQLYGPGGSIYFAYAFTGDTADFFVQPYAPGVYTATATEGTCVTNMSGSVTVTENALPVSTYNVTVTDGGNYCSGTPGVHVDLDNSGTGINYYLYNSNFGYAVDSLPGSNSSLDFGYQKTGVGTGSPATFSVTGINMTTGCSSNMTGSPMVTENPLPDPIYFVAATGSSSFCAGGSGVDITLSGSDNYINYQLLVNGVADTLIPGNGSGSALDYGNQTDTGIYTVTGINQTTGCTNMMPGSAHLHTYNALNVYNLSSSASSYCVGGSGVLFTMSNSDPSPVSYILYNGATPVDTVAGTGSTLSLGINTAGNYRAVAYNTSSGCTTNMTGNPVIDTNALPAQYPVTGGGDFCAGGSVNVGLVFSDVGVSYQLYRGGIAIGGSTGGSSSALDFGTFTTSGTYSVFASNVITGCGDSMANDVTVSGKGLPTAYTVTGGGSFCVGGTGVPVGLSNSDGGIRYELYNGYSAGVSLNGGGGALGYGLQTATGHYTVVATDTTTGCTQNMTGGAVVTTNPLPAVNNVTGGGGFCAGSTGVHLGLDGSTTGIQYHLMNGLIPAGMVNGTGGALDFGITTVAGTYTVTANNVTSGCTSNMNGSGVVTVNPLPAQYTVTGGGAYCAGGGGADIGLNNSDPGVNYQVYVGGAPSGGYVSGTGIILDLGYQAGAGTYTVTGANAATGCASSMLGSTNVSVNPLPAIYTVTGSGHFCAGGTGIAVLLSGSHTGISYQLYNGTSLAGRAVTGTGTGVSFGSQTTDGTYTAVATNTATGCSSNMNGSGTVSVDPLPDAFTITGGGNYCAGGTGVAVGLSGSVSGINYRLYNGTTPEGLAVGGTGTLITFGLQRDGGSVYTVGATNTTTGCMNNMTGTTSVVVNPVVTPAVSITTSTGDDTACIGAATLYTAVPSYGGLSPLYQWTVNGLPTASGSAYTYIASGGDVVGVTMSGDAACATTSTASKSLTMNVIPYQTPSANITINPGNNVCHGTTVSLAATSDYGGATPGYAWLRNSIPVGAGMSYSYTPGTADNGDVLIFRLNSNYRCRTINTDTVFSNAIVMVVDSAETPAFKISSHLGPVIGVGRVDTFTATLTGATKGQISYQWMINNTPVPGATSALYIDFDVFNNDKVSCDVTRSGACGNETASQSFTVVTLVNVGVQQITGAGTDISVLPNPNKGAFTVKGTLGVTGDEDVTLEVTDMLGQVVYKSNVTARGGVLDEHIQLSNAANGMYLLSLHSAVANNVYHIVVDQ